MSLSDTDNCFVLLTTKITTHRLTHVRVTSYAISSVSHFMVQRAAHLVSLLYMTLRSMFHISLPLLTLACSMALRHNCRKHLFTGRKHCTASSLLYFWGVVAGKVIQDGFDPKEWGDSRTWAVRKNCNCTDPICGTRIRKYAVLTDSSPH